MENHQKLSKDYAQSQEQCKVTADQVAHHFLLNGKVNSTYRPSKAKITDNHITEHALTSPFTMEELMKSIKILKNNKCVGLDDMLCEQIKHLGPKATVWLKEMMKNILVSKKFPKPWRKFKVIAILKPDKDSSLPKSYRLISLLCHTYKLVERMVLDRLNPITEHTIIKEQGGFIPGKSCTSQLLNLTQYIEDGYEKSPTTGTVFVDLSSAYGTVNHRVLLTKLYGMTEDAEFTKLSGSMTRNSMGRKADGAIRIIVLFNVYTNDQPVHNETRSFTCV